MVRYKRGFVNKVSKPSRVPLVMKVILVLIFISLINVAIFLYSNNRQNTKIEYNLQPISTDNITITTLRIPAVDDKGNGLVTDLVIETMPGSGRTLVDIDNLLFWADTQQSIRTARLVAANITRLDINNYDLIYNVHANATVIGGQSAGAALALSTIAALEKKQFNNKTMITGTINHDGTIGPIGGVLEKARVAKVIQTNLFLYL